MAILQKIHKEYSDIYDVYYRYFQLLLGLNDLEHIPKSELQLLSFIAVHDNISNTTTRRDFLKKYGTTTYTLNNNVSNLCKKGYLIKELDKKVRLHPQFRIGNHKELNLQIKLYASNREEDKPGVQSASGESS